MNRKFSWRPVLVVTILMILGCSDSGPNNGLSFSNNMEAIYGWTTNRQGNIVYFKNARSGRYVSAMDSSNIFGPTFEMRLKEIDAGPLKRITAGGWFNPQQNGASPELAIDIRDKDGNTKEWISMSGKDVIKNTGEWTWLELSLDLSVKNRNQPDNIFRIYPFNKSGSVALVDDLEVRFEK